MDVILYSKLMQLNGKVEDIKKISTPTGFKWSENPMEGHIFRTETGITTDFDVANFRPTGKTYWVDPNGSDSNSGEDADHPLQLISTAMNKADVAVVMLKTGFYNYGRLPKHLNGYSKSVAVVAADGAIPVLGTQEGTSGWAKSDGYTYVYEAQFASNGVYDTQYNIAYRRLLSIEDVDSIQASFYSANGKTYVHTKNSDAATGTYIKPCRNYDNFRITASGAITIYLEGITLVGGGYGAFRVTADGTNRPKVYAKNCRFYGSVSNAACYLEGCESVLQNCEAGYAGDDGFGYHAKTIEPLAVEINCEGHHNGIEGDTDNGSTMHDGGCIIRVNGSYHHNRGPNVADVHNMTDSWNIGCHAWRADQSGQTTQNADFVCADNGADMWLDNCSAFGSYYSLLANSTGKVYERGNAFANRYVGSDCMILSY